MKGKNKTAARRQTRNPKPEIRNKLSLQEVTKKTEVWSFLRSLCFLLLNIRGSLVQIVNFDETNSGAAVVSGEDGSVEAGWKGDIDACVGRIRGANDRRLTIIIES